MVMTIRFFAFLFIFGLMVCCTPCFVDAAISVEVEKSMKPEIKRQLAEAVDSLIDERRVCEDLGMTWPLRSPSKQPKSINDEVMRRARDIAYKEYPRSLEQGFRQDAEALFQLFKRPSKVKVMLKDGTMIKGVLRGVNAKFLHVDNNEKIRVADLDIDSLARVDAKVAARRKKAYVRVKLTELGEQRQALEMVEAERISDELYIASGYIQINGEWKARKKFFRSRIEQLRKDLAVILDGPLKTKVYYENGLVLYNGEWMQRAQAEDFELQRQPFDGGADEFFEDEPAGDGGDGGDGDVDRWD
jgi:small nuclear ribonucleoprotein (snRNP)-like protein